MSASELAARVREVLDVDAEAFRAAAREEAEELKAEVTAGTFDNSQALIGLELELYAVAEPTDGLRRVPRQLLGLIGFEKELGLHNAEMQTSPEPLTSYGLDAQLKELQAHLAPAIEKTSTEDIRLVADGMWTVPPTGETTTEYLTDSVEHDGIRLATNMSDAIRYHAMANTDYPSRMTIDAPHVSLEAETIFPESLITSIQPHYQVPHAPDIPEYFRYALRVAGPLLALGVNAPFFPPDLYDDAPDADIVADAHMEHRIGVFESVLNPPEDADGAPKVCFPPDFDSVEAVIDDIFNDALIVPQDVTAADRFDDAFMHLRHKHGSYWRWVRPVFEAPSRSSANARIEFRPLPAQPTLRDSVAFEAVFAGYGEPPPPGAPRPPARLGDRRSELLQRRPRRPAGGPGVDHQRRHRDDGDRPDLCRVSGVRPRRPRTPRAVDGGRPPVHPAAARTPRPPHDARPLETRDRPRARRAQRPAPRGDLGDAGGVHRQPAQFPHRGLLHRLAVMLAGDKHNPFAGGPSKGG